MPATRQADGGPIVLGVRMEGAASPVARERRCTITAGHRHVRRDAGVVGRYD
jgi:hypothetical protein